MGDWCAGDDFAAEVLSSSPSQEALEAEKLAAEYEPKIPSPDPDGVGSTISVEKRDKTMEERKTRGQRKCITSQPPIFAHHHPLGGESDIGGLGGGYARNIETKYVRLSTRMNLEALLRGDPEETLVDQWPDY